MHTGRNHTGILLEACQALARFLLEAIANYQSWRLLQSNPNRAGIMPESCQNLAKTKPKPKSCWNHGGIKPESCQNEMHMHAEIVLESRWNQGRNNRKSCRNQGMQRKKELYDEKEKRENEND